MVIEVIYLAIIIVIHTSIFVEIKKMEYEERVQHLKYVEEREKAEKNIANYEPYLLKKNDCIETLEFINIVKKNNDKKENLSHIYIVFNDTVYTDVSEISNQIDSTIMYKIELTNNEKSDANEAGTGYYLSGKVKTFVIYELYKINY